MKIAVIVVVSGERYCCISVITTFDVAEEVTDVAGVLAGRAMHRSLYEYMCARASS